MTFDLRSEKVITHFRGRLFRQERQQGQGPFFYLIIVKEQTKKATVPRGGMSHDGAGPGVAEVLEWGGGGMRWVQRMGMPWSFAGNGEGFGIYSKCRGKLWEG